MDHMETKLSPQEKIAQIRQVYEALNAGNVEGALERFSDDLVFDTPVFPQQLRGKAALRQAVNRIFDTTDEYTLEPHDILADDDHVVVVLTVRGRRGDRVLNAKGVHVIHLDEEGKVAELWAITDPQPHLALWGDA